MDGGIRPRGERADMDGERRQRETDRENGIRRMKWRKEGTGREEGSREWRFTQSVRLWADERTDTILSRRVVE